MDEVFFAGGALTPGHASYIRRTADGDAMRIVTGARKYFHMIAPRQMGKTSLAMRLSADLVLAGWSCGYVDLSTISRSVEEPAWYGKLGRLLSHKLTPGRHPTLASETDLREYLLDEVLVQEGAPGRVALFFDEVGAMLGHPLADSFFMTLRSLYNERGDYKGLLVAGFLGTVDTERLVKDKNISPFNVSEPVQLEEYTREETSELTDRLRGLGVTLDAAALQLIYDWTSGHPYLCQRICLTLEGWAEAGALASIGPAQVELAVREAFFNPLKLDSNIKHISEDVASISSAGRAVLRKVIADEEASPYSPGFNELYLTGLVKRDAAGRVVIRNRVYEQALAGERGDAAGDPPGARPADDPDAACIPAPVATVALLTDHIPTAHCHHLDERTYPLITVTVNNTGQGCADSTVRATALIEDYSDTASCSFGVGRDKVEHVCLLPVLKSETVATLNEIRARTLHITVEQESPTPRTLYKRSQRVHLLARNTALLGIARPDGTVTDLTEHLAAWVTPHRPELDQLLNRAAVHHPSGQFVGYQAATAAQSTEVVREQARALFTALKKDAGLTYISSGLSLGAVPGHLTQRVRLPRESLAAGGSANCIDGTVLFASLLELASLSPLIVLIPGHAFVGWKTWKNLDAYEFLETTMIHSAEFDVAQQQALRAYSDAKQKGYFARPLFDPHGFARLIDVSTARTRKIYPLE
ncbi:MAG TPA: AAA-like domain-containing protein [Pyrinomonadaceae bacterium]|jgi:hypothetical protein